MLISLLEVCQEGGVIHDIMDVLGRPQGSYPGSFVSISLFLAELLAYVTFVTKRDTHTQTDKHLANLYQICFNWVTIVMIDHDK